MDLRFSEYEKMVKDLNGFHDYFKMTNVDWMVTEKVHGANFSFHTDGENVQVARRRAFLNGEENFFNHKDAEFMNHVPESVKKAFAKVKELLGDDVTQLTIYGELFGGKYEVNGRDMGTRKIKPVQLEVQYCPDIKWCAFDMMYSREGGAEAEYVDPIVANEIFEEFSIPYLKPLFVGNMNKAVNYEIGFDSTLPKLYGLPALPKGSNKAEGIVVKPVRTLKCMLTRGSEMKRVIMKIKIAEFEEERKMPKKTSGKKEKPVNPMQLVIKSIMRHATEQRLASAISKCGRPSDDNTLLIDEFTTDLFYDMFDSDHEIEYLWDALEADKKDLVKGMLLKKTESLIKKFDAL